MVRSCDTNKPYLQLVYEMWDTMIFEVKKIIFENEKKSDLEESCFWNVVRKVLEDMWCKSNTFLHCLAHSLNPSFLYFEQKYMTIILIVHMCTTEDWKKEHPHLMTPDHDSDVTKMRKICIKRLFPGAYTRTAVTLEFANFSGCFEEFGDEDSI
ncbi:hypothetical protein ACS0TY_005988 [Phlomoides rotata]